MKTKSKWSAGEGLKDLQKGALVFFSQNLLRVLPLRLQIYEAGLKFLWPLK